MSESEQDTDVISDLRERVLRLEGLYSVIDLLGIPGLLAGGAAKVFDTTQTADSLGDQTPGFYPKESAGDGLSIRWTRFPEPVELSIPTFQGYPFRLELTALRMPHIQAPEDIVLKISGVGPLLFATVAPREPSASVFAGEFISQSSGLLTATITSRTYLEAAGSDPRRLGVPFMSLRSFPCLPGGVGKLR